MKAPKRLVTQKSQIKRKPKPFKLLVPTKGINKGKANVKKI